MFPVQVSCSYDFYIYKYEGHITLDDFSWTDPLRVWKGRTWIIMAAELIYYEEKGKTSSNQDM